MEGMDRRTVRDVTEGGGGGGRGRRRRTDWLDATERAEAAETVRRRVVKRCKSMKSEACVCGYEKGMKQSCSRPGDVYIDVDEIREMYRERGSRWQFACIVDSFR
jgi:hypothetical protein